MSYFDKEDLEIESNNLTKNMTPEMLEKVKEHTKLCNMLQDLYIKKNSDYGDSMHPLYEEYGLTAFLVMFSTKIQRIKSLMNKDNANFESLEDSLIDLANYALIAVTEIKAERCKQISSAKVKTELKTNDKQLSSTDVRNEIIGRLTDDAITNLS